MPVVRCRYLGHHPQPPRPRLSQLVHGGLVGLASLAMARHQCRGGAVCCRLPLFPCASPTLLCLALVPFHTHTHHPSCCAAAPAVGQQRVCRQHRFCGAAARQAAGGCQPGEPPCAACLHSRSACCRPPICALYGAVPVSVTCSESPPGGVLHRSTFTKPISRACFLCLPQNRVAAIALAKSQVDYALGSAGRSYVVGWGTNPPLRVGLPVRRLLPLRLDLLPGCRWLSGGSRNSSSADGLAAAGGCGPLGAVCGSTGLLSVATSPPVLPVPQCHHAGASCPDRPAPCGWDQFDAPTPNPQVCVARVLAVWMGATQCAVVRLGDELVEIGLRCLPARCCSPGSMPSCLEGPLARVPCHS